MSVPTPEQVRVATGALRADGQVWQRQGAAIGDAGAQAASLSMTRIEAGMFQLLVDAYQQVQAQVVARCAEGRTAMDAVAATLEQVADTYEREEAATVHRLRNLY